MKKVAIKMFLREARDRKTNAKRSLAAERAKIKLPYKPNHLTEDELRQGLEKLAA